jgi:hypothetical protein
MIYATTSPEVTSEPCCALVDTALAPDEIRKRLVQTLKFGRVPQHAGPFAAGSKIYLARVGGTENHGREGFVDLYHQPSLF